MTRAMVDKGLSEHTAAHIRVTLRRALGDAQRDGLVPRNAPVLARPPRVATRAFEAAGRMGSARASHTGHSQAD
jgi:hypothetical protein